MSWEKVLAWKIPQSLGKWSFHIAKCQLHTRTLLLQVTLLDLSVILNLALIVKLLSTESKLAAFNIFKKSFYAKCRKK